MCPARAAIMTCVAVHAPVCGSYSSAKATGFVPSVVPPATKHFAIRQQRGRLSKRGRRDHVPRSSPCPAHRFVELGVRALRDLGLISSRDEHLAIR